MHNFMQDRLKRDGILLCLFVHTAIILAMESPRSTRSLSPKPDLLLKPDQIIQVFDPKKELRKGTLWNELIPKNILIAPDGKGLIMTGRGNVKHLLFNNQSGSNIIIEHSCAKKCFPMVAVSKKKDGSLVIVSAGNYKNEENECVAEYILFCNGSYQVRKLNRSIQAISLDLYGTTLAIASKRSVVAIDLKTNHITKEESLKGSNDNWIVDVAINSKGTALIAAGNQGGIQWMSLSRERDALTLFTLKQAIIRDNIIKKIYYPNCDALLYVTQDGQVNIMTMDGLLMPNNEDAVTNVFVKSPFYDKVEVDLRNVATVHWSEKTQEMRGDSGMIEMYYQIDKTIEKIILEIPLLEDSYCYITEFGQYATAKGHLLNVALANHSVIALTTDGNIRVWSLPVNIVVDHDVDKKSEVNKDKQKRSRPGSEKSSKHVLTSSDGVETGEKKKSSPRLLQLFKTSSGSTSPVGSRDTSPLHSPHESDPESKTTKANEYK